ncbi:8339_t:CDS:2 [Ambispora leptoticha]|uniref:8339_t:CDS:1 n=1 Tax=Ambispora leptoticha TaxID=144679 RepID=A0A9N8ZTQ5_9GLOM|nr:8339_t:CDS:2 [Ambispora leptoticha]
MGNISSSHTGIRRNKKKYVQALTSTNANLLNTSQDNNNNFSLSNTRQHLSRSLLVRSFVHNEHPQRPIQKEHKSHTSTEAQHYLSQSLEQIKQMHVPHYLNQFIWQSNFSSPVYENLVAGARCLDAGCSIGEWVLDMASQYPRSEFIGCDVSTIYPAVHEIRSRNAMFVQANILDGLPFEDNSFEFVRMSLFFTTLTEIEWLKVIEELTRILRPEPDFDLYDMGPKSKDLVNALLTLYSMRGINPRITQKFELILAAASGLTDTHHEIRNIAVDPSDGKSKFLQKEMLSLYFESINTSEIMEYLGMNEEEYQELWEECEREFIANQTYYKLYRIWTQKYC